MAYDGFQHGFNPYGQPDNANPINPPEGHPTSYDPPYPYQSASEQLNMPQPQAPLNAAPPQGYYPMQTPQAGMPGYPQMAPMQTPMATGGYPAQPQVVPQQTIVQVQPDLGTQYQQQREFSSSPLTRRVSLTRDPLLRPVFARCARGDHDVTLRYGPCGIIAAIVFFPIGLIFLLYVGRSMSRRPHFD